MAVSPTAPARRHSPWVRWGRFGVSAALLAILIAKIDPDDFVPPHRSLAGALFFLCSGILLMGLSFLVASWRWQRVLAVYDAHVPLRTLTKHYLAGQFVGNALPSTVGGDVLRISRCSKDTGSTEVAFASVVLERLTGFVALPLLIFVGFAARPDLLDVPRSWIAIVIAVGTLLVLLAILVLAASPRLAGRFVHRANWTRFIGIVHVGVDRLRRDPRDAIAALAAAVAYQLTVVASRLLRGAHDRADDPERQPCSRTSPRSRWSRCSRSRWAGSAFVKGCSRCCCTRSACPRDRPSRSVCSGTG